MKTERDEQREELALTGLVLRHGKPDLAMTSIEERPPVGIYVGGQRITWRIEHSDGPLAGLAVEFKR